MLACDQRMPSLKITFLWRCFKFERGHGPLFLTPTFMWLPFVYDTLIFFNFHRNEVQLLLGHNLQLIPPHLSSLSYILCSCVSSVHGLWSFITDLSAFIIVSATQSGVGKSFLLSPFLLTVQKYLRSTMCILILAHTSMLCTRDYNYCWWTFNFTILPNLPNC